MPVNTAHPSHAERAHQWKRVRDVLAGADAVKSNAGQYIRRPPALGMGEWPAYVRNAPFFAASRRTLDGLTGAIFRKEPVVTAPESFARVLDNVDGRGTPFGSFAKRAVREVIALGSYGVLVDVGSGGGDPFLAGYAAESIINWKTTVIDGRPVLSLVVLREFAEQSDPDDPFEAKTVERFRVIELARVRGGSGLVHAVTVFEKRATMRSGEDFVRVSGPTVPTRRGEPLDFIPFTFLGPTDLAPDVEEPPLLDLVNVNLDHFAVSAGTAHSMWFCAHPMVWVAGNFKGGAKVNEIELGSSTAWQLDQGSEVNILEFKGQGLGALETRLARLEAHIAALGARLLEDQKAGVEAAATVAMRHRGEDSVLASIANTSSRGFGQALSWANWWHGGQPNEVEVELNKDFLSLSLAPQQMVQLVAGWQQGGYGGEVLYHNLKDGERIPEGMTFEDWQTDIENNGPAGDFMRLGDEDDIDDDDGEDEAT